MNMLSIDELKKLDISSAVEYADYLRHYLIKNVSESGGHLASNLGIVEISLGLIRCFDAPYDKIIYDVGHQSYVHKLLTNRVFSGADLRKFNGYSGFTKRDESKYDPFGAGHSSTALSAALGFSKASKINGEKYYSVAVIGDGAFSTGMTFEALNNIKKDDKVIIILNDNEMSISKSEGNFSTYLNKMRVSEKYLRFKRKTKKIFKGSKFFYKTATAIKSVTKRLLLKPNFFEDLGVTYLGPTDGNDLSRVELLLKEAKTKNTPVLIHFITKKGKGYQLAEDNPNKFHFVSQNSTNESSFSTEYAKHLCEYSRTNPKTVAITAAMADGTGLTAFKNEFPDRFFDVGISEEHAGTFVAALSAAGLLPFYSVYSTFFQRSYDQVIHDIALQNLRAVISLDRAGLVGEDGPTHHGVFDVSMLLNIPGTTIYSPSYFGELKYAFYKAVNETDLSVLRFPKDTDNKILSLVFPTPSDYSIDSLKAADVLFVTYGRIAQEAVKAKLSLSSKGISASILKFVKIKPIDFNKINEIIKAVSPKFICIVEEGMKIGGFGEYFLSEIDTVAKKEVMAINEEFLPHGTIEQLYSVAGLSGDKIAQRVEKCLKI